MNIFTILWRNFFCLSFIFSRKFMFWKYTFACVYPVLEFKDNFEVKWLVFDLFIYIISGYLFEVVGVVLQLNISFYILVLTSANAVFDIIKKFGHFYALTMVQGTSFCLGSRVPIRFCSKYKYPVWNSK